MNASRNDGGTSAEAPLPRDLSTSPTPPQHTASARGPGVRRASRVHARWSLRVGKSGTALSLAFHVSLIALLIANAPTSIADESPTPIAEPIQLRLAGTVATRPPPERSLVPDEPTPRRVVERVEFSAADFPPEEIPPQERVARRTPRPTPPPTAARTPISEADWEAAVRPTPPAPATPPAESDPVAPEITPAEPIPDAPAPPEGAEGADAATTTDAELLPEHRLEPDYPRSCIRLGHEGTVEFELSVAADGTVTAARVTTSSGCDALDRSAERTALRLRYSPATRDGIAIPSVTTWRVESRPEA